MDTMRKDYEHNENIWKRYDRGDTAAGAAIDREVNKRMTETGESYIQAMRGLRATQQEARFTLSQREQGTTASALDVHNAGVTLSNAAARIMDRDGLSYKDAFRVAAHENPTSFAAYSQGVNLPTNTVEELKRNHQKMKAFAVSDAVTQLSNLIGGLPRLANGQPDFDSAAQVLSNAKYRSLCADAADSTLTELAKDIISNRGLSGSTATNMPAALTEARTRYPAVAAMASGGAVTADGLRAICWPKNQ